MWLFTGANIALLCVVFMFIVGLVALVMKDGILDFVKANFGLLVLLLLFMTLLAVGFHVFHENDNKTAADFLAWLEQKAGEVLAAIMTVIVGVRTASSRSTDNGNGNGNGSKPAPTPAPSTAGVPHP